MSFDNEVLGTAHKHCIFNMDEIKQSIFCGCFYCLETFKPIDIVELTDKGDFRGMTALCPHCGIDSVIGDESGFPIQNKDFLKAMYSRYF